jgi:hypothetical protein
MPSVVILTSSAGLGVYIPSLLIQRQLREMGVAADVEVLEGYFSAEHQRRHLAHKAAFHKDFALASMANRMARPVEDCFDQDRIHNLLGDWASAGRRDFVVWSGFWLPALDKYRKITQGRSLNIDLCRIDAEISASFRAHQDLDVGGSEVWLWNWAERRIVREIPITTARSTPLPFDARENRLLVHGGGWGLGNYLDILPELERTRYALDVVVLDTGEAPQRRRGDRRLIIDPQWRPWHTGGDNRHSFPAVGEVINSARIQYFENDTFHEIYNVIKTAKGVISKPGGGTLIDCLNSATPLIILDSFGQAEARNAALWEYLCYGISFANWQASGYSETLLKELHMNIMRRPRTGPGYPRELVDRLRFKKD